MMQSMIDFVIDIFRIPITSVHAKNHDIALRTGIMMWTSKWSASVRLIKKMILALQIMDASSAVFFFTHLQLVSSCSMLESVLW